MAFVDSCAGQYEECKLLRDGSRWTPSNERVRQNCSNDCYSISILFILMYICIAVTFYEDIYCGHSNTIILGHVNLGKWRIRK